MQERKRVYLNVLPHVLQGNCLIISDLDISKAHLRYISLQAEKR